MLTGEGVGMALAHDLSQLHSTDTFYCHSQYTEYQLFSKVHSPTLPMIAIRTELFLFSL